MVSLDTRVHVYRESLVLTVIQVRYHTHTRTYIAIFGMKYHSKIDLELKLLGVSESISRHAFSSQFSAVQTFGYGGLINSYLLTIVRVDNNYYYLPE